MWTVQTQSCARDRVHNVYDYFPVLDVSDDNLVNVSVKTCAVSFFAGCRMQCYTAQANFS